MAWNPLDQPRDYILLAGKKSPGVAQVVGAGSPRKWDERRGYALTGATLVFRGIGLAAFAVKLRLYTPADWDEWDVFRRIVEKPPVGSRPRAMDVWHPYLEMLGIKSVVVEDLSQPDQVEDGVFEIVIKFREFRRVTPSLAKPEGASATTVDPVDQKIEELTRQVQELADE